MCALDAQKQRLAKKQGDNEENMSGVVQHVDQDKFESNRLSSVIEPRRDGDA